MTSKSFLTHCFWYQVAEITAIGSSVKLKFTSTAEKSGGGFVVSFSLPLVHCDFVTLPSKK